MGKKLGELLQNECGFLEEKITSQLPDIFESSYQELVSFHRSGNSILIPEAKMQSPLQGINNFELLALPFAIDREEENLDDTLVMTSSDAKACNSSQQSGQDIEYVHANSTVSLEMETLHYVTAGHGTAISEGPAARDPITEDQGVFGEPVCRHSWKRHGNNEERSPHAEKHQEIFSAQETAEPWNCWIDFDNCGPSFNDIGSDYPPHEQSTVNLIDDFPETILETSHLPCFDTLDLLPHLSEELDLEDALWDNRQSTPDLFERGENKNNEGWLDHPVSGSESVKCPLSNCLMLGDSRFPDIEILSLQYGDKQTFQSLPTEHTSTHQELKDHHTVGLPNKDTVIGSFPDLSKDLEDGYEGQYTWW